MECQDKLAAPARKLIQARLPFKRLNPVPKEKLNANPGVKKARSSPNVLDQNTPCLDLSHPLPDNVENTCQVENETQFLPKLINGKGPLDVFVQKGTKNEASQPSFLIDLTGDSCHGLNDNVDHNTSSNVTEKALEKIENQASTQKSTCTTHEDIQMEVSSAPIHRDDLSSATVSEMATSSTKKSNLKNVIFERKMPVVVLEDIMTARSPQALPLERSLASGNETVESCPEEDTASQKIHQNAEEKEKLRLQKDQERAEKGRLKEEARAAKERAREEARRKKEEEKELKEKERREKKEKDEKEKAEKLQEKRKKEEEKRLKEEEKRLKEEEKRIKAEKAEITRFFQKPKTQPVPKTLAGWCGKFAPFEIKENMVLAPLCRVAADQDLLDQLDWLLQGQDCSTSFLEELKSREPCKSGPTLVSNRSSDDINSDVVIVGSSQVGDVPERKKFGRMKLLQFCENHRPAYWGTWNRKSSVINPRNPWSKDDKLLDYEVESDEEWEEEEPGESLSHSEGDDDEDGGEEEDEDDGFFVPHGYLSEDEGVTEECDPENHKARQKLKAKEWDELITKGKRFRILQPVKIGCIWEGTENSDSMSPDVRLLQQFAMVVLDSNIIDEEQIEKNNKKETKNQQILEQLLPLLHGNVNGSKVIIQEFQECCRMGLLLGNNCSVSMMGSGGSSPTCPDAPTAQTSIYEGNTVPSKARLKRIISENSVYEKRPDHRMCWYVHPEVLKSYGQENLPVPCQWNYVTQVPSAETTEMDGFQADTEEEDDDECIIVDVQPSKGPPVLMIDREIVALQSFQT
ncbi:hypothetical protein JD844_034188 [Phrynosoma platyrhinos]|uniref:Chromatin assembly factor 1 subunit A n=1 Tax=Phrynosoma platyrhinos TaxID=52577 RepID=A0ABQ7T8I8_PHRPL|nr:hypothetical protein JD844_034188 [Phrynosoma platyrhinos]